MKKAVALPEFSDVKPFSQPQGVIDVQLDKITNRLATPSCPDDYTIAFVAGTEPRDTCDQGNGGGIQGFFSRIFGGNSEKALPPPTANPPGQNGNSGTQTAEEEAKKKKGFFGKIVGAFKGDGGSQKTDSNGGNTNSSNTSNEKQSPAPSKVGDGSPPPQ
jgi:penicillin-binding protein 1B